MFTFRGLSWGMAALLLLDVSIRYDIRRRALPCPTIAPRSHEHDFGYGTLVTATVAPERLARDRSLLNAAAFLRALGTGMVGVVIGVYLARLGFDPTHIGFVITAGLAGAAVATLVATFAGDRFGRRRFLIALAALGAVGCVAFTRASGPLAIGVAAFVGMLNGMGRDRGAALALEQAVLPATAPGDRRTQVIAWYNVLQDSGHALGSLMAGLPLLFRGVFHVGEIDSMRWALGIYAVLMIVTTFLYAALSPAVEIDRTRPKVVISAESRRVLWRICALFSLDSLGGGFLTAALLSFFFFKRFGASEAVIGGLFFGARVMNALSHLAAAWLAQRIGLVNTMVFTHIPSSLLLATVAFAPTFPVAAVLFLLREGLVEMDVPTRQSYVMGVVRPEERTFASGVTSLVRMGAWAVAPSFAGLFMQDLSLATPLYVGAAMKITYDVLLYVAFKRIRPPEEVAAPARAG
jgi:MFS family permease